MSVVRNSVYSLAGTALPIVIGIVTVPFYIRIIGMERYGALSIAWLLLGYFGQADFGIGRAITQRIASLKDADGERLAQIVWSGLVAITGFGLVGALLIYWGGQWFFGSVFKVEAGLRSELAQSLWMLALCNPIVALTGVTSGSLIGIERFRLISLSNLIGNSALQLFPLLAAMHYGAYLGVLIAASLIARLLALAMMGAAVWWRFLKGRRMAVSGAEACRLISFGKWVMLSAFIGPLMIFADRFVIGAVLGAAAVAVYSIPFQIASRTMVLPAAIAQVLYPRFALDGEEQSRTRAAHCAIAIGLLFAPPILILMALAEPLLQLWLGPALDPRSVLVVRIVLAGFWVNGIANAPYALIQARGNPRFTALLHLAELPFYLAALYLLGLRWGLAGLAAAFSLRCLVDMIVLLKAGHGWTGEVIGKLFPPAVLVLLALAMFDFLPGWQPAVADAILFGALSIGYGLWQMPGDMARSFRGPLERLLPGLRINR